MDKSAIKKEYKQAKQPMGVYRIRVSGHDSVFIGYAVDLTARFNRHKAELKFGNHRNRDLQKLWNSLGEAAFEFDRLDLLEHRENTPEYADEELRTLTDMWVQKLEPEGVSVVRL